MADALMMVSNTSGAGWYRADATHMSPRWSIPTASRNWKLDQVLTAHGNLRKSTTSQNESSRKKAAKATCANILSPKPDWEDPNPPASLSRRMWNIWPGAIQVSGGGLEPNHWVNASVDDPRLVHFCFQRIALIIFARCITVEFLYLVN